MSVKKGLGAPVPLRVGPRRYRVIYPTPGQPIVAVILSDTWLGLNCHWVSSAQSPRPRTVLCTAPNWCICSSTPTPIKWHGYLAIARLVDQAIGIISISPTTVETLKKLSENRTTLRGMVIEFRKRTSHPNSPIVGVYTSREWVGQLPDAPDIVPSLEPLYGSAAIALSLRHNLPADSEGSR